MNGTTPNTNTDGVGKSKRGRKKVHFENGDLPEPTFNFSSKPDGDGGKAQAQPSSFGKAAKGGKGTKASNGVKMAAKEPLQLKIDPELLKNAECLMDSEAANILMGVQEQMVELSKDSDIKLPVSFDKALQYAKGSTQYTNTHSVRQVLEALKVHGVTDGEICVLANVCPESVDEVFALVPSLKPKWHVLREPLVNVLSELARLRK